MAYLVSAVTRGGGAVSVIVADSAAALKMVDEYREDGFTSIVLKDLDGNSIPVERLAAGEPPLADSK